MLGHIIRWWTCFLNEGREEAKARAARKLAQEDADIALAEAELSKYQVCPRCNTEDAVIGSHQDCMDVVLDYCSHAWHYFAWDFMRRGCSFHGLTRREVLLAYGQKLARKED
jgi:hypothetical protein